MNLKQLKQIKDSVTLSTRQEVIDYAQSLNLGYNEVKTGWDSKNAFAFELTFDNVILKIDFYNNKEFVFTYYDKNKEPLYSISSTSMVDEVDWNTILNPKAYFAEEKKNYTKAIQKHKAAAKSAYSSYQRTDKRSYYDKYLREKYDYVEKYEKKLNKIEQIINML